EEQKRILEVTVDSIQSLINDIGTTVSGVDSITGAAKACEDSKVVIVDAMSSLSAISEENAAAAEETSASMEELNATVNTLASTADGLKEIANALMEEMSFFKG
ncbi:MAG: methyl-accepting chemotaxis protein, partial [Lachnospiraceae bacterium]|nr:methyl-accepting chemotaxis protein [Lachnospiraceae bacterium]